MCTDCAALPSGGPGRRQFLRLGAGAAGAAALGLSPAAVLADDCAHFLADAQAAATPAQAIGFLAEGNARFAAGAPLHCDPIPGVVATAGRQSPFACVLACIDSRSAPELVFDQQIGDIFVARVAGNVVTPEVLGSFEYATVVAGTKAIVVLGHNHCGAVKGAIDRANVGANLTTILDLIEPAIAEVAHDGAHDGTRTSQDHHLVQAVAESNVRHAVAALTANSPVIAALVASGAVTVAGALYDIDTGVVTFLA